MHMQNDAVRQRGMHGGLERCTRVPVGGVNALPQAFRHFLQIQRNEDVIAQSVGHPAAGRLDPNDAVQLERAVASASLREQRIGSDALRELQ